MALVPCAAAVAKAPPAGILPRAQFFDNLAGTPGDSEANSPSSSEQGYEDALPAITFAEPDSINAHSNASASIQPPPPQPGQENPQHTPPSVSSAGQPAADTQHRSQWADISEAPNALTTQQRTGDIRLRANSAPRPQPKMGMWASRRFFTEAPTEEEFIKQWLLALQDHDWSTQQVWRDYCRQRSDGTFDPLAHAPPFTRRFLFVYG